MQDNWGGMGVTLVDSLDTLWIMGLKVVTLHTPFLCVSPVSTHTMSLSLSPFVCLYMSLSMCLSLSFSAFLCFSLFLSLHLSLSLSLHLSLSLSLYYILYYFLLISVAFSNLPVPMPVLALVLAPIPVLVSLPVPVICRRKSFRRLVNGLRGIFLLDTVGWLMVG